MVGRGPAAIIDPGPLDRGHLDALAAAVHGAESCTLLLTHDHGDHSAGAATLGDMLGIPVHGPGGVKSVVDGDRFETSLGPLVAVSTPGHTREHFCYHLTDSGAVFVGDMILGEGNTTWIGEYSGGVADYLDSLDVLSELDASVLYPGHGDAISDAAARIDRFRQHRLTRIAQVRDAMEGLTDPSVDELVTAVYPGLEAGLRPAAASSVEAILDYLTGRR